MNPSRNNKRRWPGTVGKSAVAFLLFVGLCEVGIRLSGTYATLSEKSGNGFMSLFDVTHTGTLHKHQPLQDIHISNTEFSYVHRIDSLGFRNGGDTADRPYEVLALGDSFTEGLGAPQDSTWPARLGALWDRQVYNAGIMGSDPVYGLRLLEQEQLPFAPRQVIVAVNFSDVTDVVIRGGTERFRPDGTVRYRAEPAFMPLYRYSHFFRAVLHLLLGYDYMFNAPSEREHRLNEALDTLTETLVQTRDWCARRHIRMKVYIHPVPQEYYRTLDRRLNFRRVDELLPRLLSRGVDAVNLRSALEARLPAPADWKAVSWPVDGHFNAKGYALVAECMANDLQKDPETWLPAGK